MIATRDGQNAYIDAFERFEKKVAAGDPAWLRRLRRDALARFADLGFPTMREEGWRHTNLAPLAEVAFHPALPGKNGISAGMLGSYLFGGRESCNLVFINGWYSPGLSTPGGFPSCAYAGSLAAALREKPDKIGEYLASAPGRESNAFVPLNTAFLSDGGFIFVPDGTRLNRTIHLVYLFAPGASPTAGFPRNLIVVGNGGEVTVVESYAGPAGGVYFTNAVTDVIAGDHSRVGHYRVQRESEEAFHVGSLNIDQAENAVVSSHSISLGGALTRNTIAATMNGEGGELTLNGLYFGRNRQHVDNHTSIIHARPHCSSRELYKGILDDRATGVFTGRIVVRPDAQKTNARQTNKNLLLSADALVNSTPQLEIFADDVKCTHGATIGRLSADALFYLRSRGIDEPDARSLLTYAFAGDILGMLGNKPLQCQLDLVLLAHMSRTEGMGAPS